MSLIPFFKTAAKALAESSPTQKSLMVFQLYWDFMHKRVVFEQNHQIPNCQAGVPAKPALVAPNDCAPRDFKTHEGRCSLIHALAHIEFNAINLALDACCRFPGMPDQYYQDWLRVAKEEAYHFNLLRHHLNAMGKDYGDYPAHNGLWEMAQKTAHSCLARMGCVPRLLEARGLDVAPQIAEKLKTHDSNAATLLEIIMRDEEQHVLIGNRWFHYMCEQEKVEPLATFKALVEQFAPNSLRKPLAKAARIRAGFASDEVEWIESVMI